MQANAAATLALNNFLTLNINKLFMFKTEIVQKRKF